MQPSTFPRQITIISTMGIPTVRFGRFFIIGWILSNTRAKTSEGYMRVNHRFAEQLQPLLHEDDLVWVHDYHFILLARELRQRRCRQRMGFFLHIPWPSKEVLTALPDHLELVEALLEFDVIGFQTKSYVLTFLDYVVRELGGTVDADGSLYALGKRASSAFSNIDRNPKLY